MPPEPVLLLGCGRWGRNILRDLVALGWPAIVVDPSEEARSLAAPLARAVHRDLEFDERFAGVIVATPASHHAAAIEGVAPWKTPIFVEKPLATSVADAERALSLGGDRLFVMDKWRYHGGVEALAMLAASGEFGPVRALHTWRLGTRHGHDDVDPIWTLLPHDLAIVREILGFVPAAAEAVAERTDGCISGMTARVGNDPDCVLEISAGRSEHRRCIELIFDTAAAIVDGARDTAIEIRSEKGVRTIAVSDEPPLRRELEAFLGYLDGGAPPRSSARDGVEIVRRIAELRALAGLDG
jgi:predicted dehydrogenase